jgi:F0F1-type ATP synthase assembly protein I
MDKILVLCLWIIVALTLVIFIFIPDSRVSFVIGIITGLICETIVIMCTQYFKKDKTTNISVISHGSSTATFTLTNSIVSSFTTSGSSEIKYDNN